MRRSRVVASLCLTGVWMVAAALANGCSAGNTPNPSGTGASGGSGGATSSSGTGGSHATSTSSSSSGQGGKGGDPIIIMDSGPEDVVEDIPVDPCMSKCGMVELCDPSHLGLDDDCDGLVDEDCGCVSGQAHFCFKGDPAYHNTAGCFDGTEVCNEQGKWGPCIGGVHAVAPDLCFNANPDACHAITAAPFAPVSLKTGTGNFSSGALTEMFTVACPPGVMPCPAVMAPDTFTALQSGEYTVTYTKTVQGDPNPKSCTYPLLVGSRGLRVELSWEHSAADSGVDLDLHVHQPNNNQPWGISPGVAQDCTWSNCVFTDFDPPQGIGSPKWFADPPAMPPTPVNWYLDPVFENNNCYFAPRGVGLDWQGLGMGCHNPRLDLDNITCQFGVTDPNNFSFCAPENVNVDFPPNGEWFRVGVHYYSSHGLTYDVHPNIKIFCNGALAADLGPQGYYMPESPVTFQPSDGSSFGGNRFWVVADVAFKADMCNNTQCVVRPVYSDPNAKTPFLTNDTAATTMFAPGYPPPP